MLTKEDHFVLEKKRLNRELSKTNATLRELARKVLARHAASKVNDWETDCPFCLESSVAGKVEHNSDCAVLSARRVLAKKRGRR
jgi:hypothetical protein